MKTSSPHRPPSHPSQRAQLRSSNHSSSGSAIVALPRLYWTRSRAEAGHSNCDVASQFSVIIIKACRRPPSPLAYTVTRNSTTVSGSVEDGARCRLKFRKLRSGGSEIIRTMRSSTTSPRSPLQGASDRMGLMLGSVGARMRRSIRHHYCGVCPNQDNQLEYHRCVPHSVKRVTNPDAGWLIQICF